MKVKSLIIAVVICFALSSCCGTYPVAYKQKKDVKKTENYVENTSVDPIE
jgi:hypothetical protein